MWTTTDSKHTRVRRSHLCQRRQHVSHSQIGRYRRVQGDQQFQQRHLRRNVHRGVPPRRRPVSDGEIRQPLGEGRVRQTRQLQSAPRADGLACRHHSGYGNSEVLHQKEYDDVKTAQAKQAFSTDFLSHFFLKSVESIIFARCKPYLCTLQAVKS